MFSFKNLLSIVKPVVEKFLILVIKFKIFI
jgi:hypothetical protein